MLLYAHNPGSQGAKRLAQALGIRRIRHNNSRFTGRRNPVVINWGASQLPDWQHRCRILNLPEAVGCMSNKLKFFQVMSETEAADVIPAFTTDRAVAQQFLDRGERVVCRTVLNGSGGRGIVVCSGQDRPLVDAPLYVLYKKKAEEYRVHVFDGQVIDVQRKARRHDFADPNWEIRNHDNGFIYAREGFETPRPVKEAAIKVMARSYLLFGAVDVVWNRQESWPYVLEINTAPGLEGTTIGNYAEAFRRYHGG